MLQLYSYWRSSASYRVRIALHLKKLKFEYKPVHLVRDGGEQNSPEYREVNPQGRVPLLVDGDFKLAQSLAILDYLDAKHPEPRLIPEDPALRARVLAFCHTLASDTQPLQNIGVLRYLAEEHNATGDQRDAFARHWIQRGLEALEAERDDAPKGEFAFGDVPTIADCVLVPQVYNAERFNCDVSRFPQLHALARRLQELPAFADAHPDRQPDAPT